VDNRLYYDMDGVLADFDKGARAALGVANTYKFEFVYGTNAFWRGLDSDPNFFGNLDMMRDACELLWHTRHLNRAVLTALPKDPVRAPIIDAQKREWVRRFIGAEVPVICCETLDKPKYCKPGDVLIDDRAVNRDNWERAGGLFVVHTSAKDSLAQLRDWDVI
jgi:5'(3')-deoxyribonucleotidase